MSSFLKRAAGASAPKVVASKHSGNTRYLLHFSGFLLTCMGCLILLREKAFSEELNRKRPGSFSDAAHEQSIQELQEALQRQKTAREQVGLATIPKTEYKMVPVPKKEIPQDLSQWEAQLPSRRA
eukprot:EG_transcript_31830